MQKYLITRANAFGSTIYCDLFMHAWRQELNYIGAIVIIISIFIMGATWASALAPFSTPAAVLRHRPNACSMVYEVKYEMTFFLRYTPCRIKYSRVW